jgi:hypothetical protein
MNWLNYYNDGCNTARHRPITTGLRFRSFLDRLSPTWVQRLDGHTKIDNVTACLNRHYYGFSWKDANRLVVGSWGKETEVRPPRDIDLLFVLPSWVYYRYGWISGNKQSRLLQEVKHVLQRTFPLTSIRGDGQVVVVPFSSYSVEVVPAFLLHDGKYATCDTNHGGRYKVIDPCAEVTNIEWSDTLTSGDCRNLIRMIKRWQDYCEVPLKSFWIELLAVEFLRAWRHVGKGLGYYDRMIRDFFSFMSARSFPLLVMPATFEPIYIGDDWRHKASNAYDRASTACFYEYLGMSVSAWQEWRKVFGPDIHSEDPWLQRALNWQKNASDCRRPAWTRPSLFSSGSDF